MANAKTPVMVLQELAVKNKWAPPQYEIVHCKQGTHNNRFDYAVSVHSIVEHGTGPSKQIGKHQAAMNALIQLKEIGLYSPKENPVAQLFNPTNPQKKMSPEESSCDETPRVKFEPTFSYIMSLRELCAENKIPDPVFEEVSAIGPPHAREFTYECRVSSIKTQGIANTKKMAKHIAAKDMLSRIKHAIPELAMSAAGDSKVSNNAITETDATVIQKYSEFDDFIPDKSIKIVDYGSCLKKLLEEKELEAEEFVECLGKPTLANLEQILGKLDLKYVIYKLQEACPYITSLAINTNSPLTTVGVGHEEREALENAINQCFTIMKIFMGISKEFD